MINLKNNKTLTTGLDQLKIPYNEETIKNFHIFINELIEYNTKINIIGPGNTENIIIKHILDPLSAFHYFPKNATIADIGCGAGIPGIPLTIIYPFKITMIESKKKKTEFTKLIIKKLKLKNAVSLCSNINEVKKKYDIITARAFATTEKILRLTKNCTTKKSSYLLYKGKIETINEELKNLSEGSIEIIKLFVPYLEAERNLLKIQK